MRDGTLELLLRASTLPGQCAQEMVVDNPLRNQPSQHRTGSSLRKRIKRAWKSHRNLRGEPTNLTKPTQSMIDSPPPNCMVKGVIIT